MGLLWPILRQAILKPHRVAVIDDNRRYTYGRLAAASFFVADQIDRMTQSRHVGLMLPTSGAFPVSLLGSWLARRVAVPLNYLLARDELHYVIADSDIDTVLTSELFLDFLGGPSVLPDHIRTIKLEEVDFSGFPNPRWPPPFDDSDLAVLLYTSGTSGRPKGVMLTHANLQADTEASIVHSGITEADGFLGVLPQFHSFGLTALTLIPLCVGATIVYTARFVPKRLVSLIKKHRPEIFIAVPSMYGAMLSVKDATPEDFRSIRLAISGGEPLPESVYDAYLERFELEIFEGYGLTETSPATHWSTPEQHRLHSVGRSLPDVRQFIVDGQDRVLEADQEGEIILAGPVVMKGYYKQPDLTSEVIFDLEIPGQENPIRAFRTGDIGKLDRDGFLYITGRKKEMMIIGGENVFPREIEEVLNQHSAIADSAVVGRSDGLRGEVPVAFVEVLEGAGLDEAEVRSHCRKLLAQFKVPREVKVVDELPRNPTGKILRRKLKTD